MGVVTRATCTGFGLGTFFGDTWDQYLPFPTKKAFDKNCPDISKFYASLAGLRNITTV